MNPLREERGPLDDIVDDFSIEQHHLAAIRAARSLGMEVKHGIPRVEEDRLDEFQDAYAIQLTMMAVQIIREEATRIGMLETIDVDEDGNEISRLTEVGRAYLESRRDEAA